jgi:hypothetical protein
LLKYIASNYFQLLVLSHVFRFRYCIFLHCIFQPNSTYNSWTIAQFFEMKKVGKLFFNVFQWKLGFAVVSIGEYIIKVDHLPILSSIVYGTIPPCHNLIWSATVSLLLRPLCWWVVSGFKSSRTASSRTISPSIKSRGMK